MTRNPSHVYLDPLDAIWLTVADRVGFRVERSGDVFASTDGRGTMLIGAPATLDSDDCLAQMILHELCHSLIEGASSLEIPDFGLDNESRAHIEREHACLRLQAWLTGRHGLRAVLAPTTDHRDYYLALPRDPLEGDEPLIGAARAGAARSSEPPWAPHLERGLHATSKVVRALRDLQAEDPNDARPPIWLEPALRPPRGFG